ncbi:MAG: acyl dehydratase [Polyangiaceae bacterium]|nr:acyl dehydratase [Polyangiaceae bacterium]
MNEAIDLEFASTPSALRYMAKAFLPKKRPQGRFDPPAIQARWSGLAAAQAAPPARREPARGDAVHPIHLHATTMRLVMAVLTHPRFPLPIWNLLQVRNRIIQHRPCPASAHLDVTVQRKDIRVVGKGVEFDLHVEMRAPDDLVLESVITFYARGRFGPASPAAPEAAPPEAPAETRASWSIPRRGAWDYGHLTGDYNGIHLWTAYARKFGFPSALAHPHRALAEILEHIEEIDLAAPLVVDVWFKGPALYERQVDLAYERAGDGFVFALRIEGDPRPAIVGRAAAR